MNINKAISSIKEELPEFVHISGKTSTGKSTLAGALRQQLGYKVIELDKVVNDAVIVPLQLPNRGQVFYEVYKKRNELQWISMFVSRVHEMLQTYKNSGARVVIDGAVANTDTLQELLAPFPDAKIIYLHPANLGTYQKYLANRFMQTNETYHAGLPLAFWELVGKPDFQQFCQDHILTPALSRSIHDYALSSQETSAERLEEIKGRFKDILVIEV